MPSGRLHSLIRFLRSTARAGDDTSADGVLLQRFVRHRDEAAFTALMERHGPMVWGVCKRVLRNADDAEDAFQAAFIVLACKARSIARPELLGSWLYRVAFRAALRARAETARRRERPAPLLDIAAPMPDADGADLRRALDEEIDRLPEKYRVPVVLCYLEGRTNDEAGRRLGCPTGTIASRLATARARLRVRLVRRGVTLPAGLLASMLAAETLAAAVPAALADGALATALSVASGAILPGTISLSGITLAKGVLRTMLLTRIRTAVIVLTVLSCVGAGVGFIATQPGADAHPQERPPAAPAGDAAGAKRMAELLQKRRDAAELTFAARMKRVAEGTALADETFFAAALRLYESELDLCLARAERIHAGESHLKRMKEAEHISTALVEAGKIREDDGVVATFYRLDAEIRLERAKAK